MEERGSGCRRFNRMLDQKNVKDIEQVLKKYRKQVLSFSELAEILKTLQLTEATKDSDKTLALEVWNLLDAKTHSGVLKQALTVLLFTLTRPPRSTSADGSTSHSAVLVQPETVGTYTESDKGLIYVLSEQERSYLYKKYAVRLKYNKLSKNSRSPSREFLDNQPTFAPQISPRSKQLSENAKSRAIDSIVSIKQPDNGVQIQELRQASVSDLLIYHQVLYDR